MSLKPTGLKLALGGGGGALGLWPAECEPVRLGLFRSLLTSPGFAGAAQVHRLAVHFQVFLRKASIETTLSAGSPVGSLEAGADGGFG